MNARERTLLFALLGIVGAGVLAIATWQWFYKPLTELNKKIADMREKRDDLKDQLDTFFYIDQKNMKEARARSLSTDHAEANFEYLTVFLTPLLKDLKVETARKTNVGDMKFTSAIQGVKKINHQVMTFSVIARGDMAKIVDVLEKIQRTPYEHRIRSFILTRETTAVSDYKERNPKLKLDMTIEAILIAGAQPKRTQPPALVDVTGKRVYASIATKNIYAGAILEPPPPKPVEKPKPPPEFKFAGTVKNVGADELSIMADDEEEITVFTNAQTRFEKNGRGGAFSDVVEGATVDVRFIVQGEKPIAKTVAISVPLKPNFNVPQYMRLSQIDHVDGKAVAYFSNLLLNEPDTRLSSSAQFTIKDLDTTYEFFKAKVLRIDSRAVHFQVKDKVFSVSMNQTLEEARFRPLTKTQLDALQLTKLYDAEWAAKQMEADKKKTPLGPFKKKTPAKK